MVMRIVCLVPSATEIVCALGMSDQIVGISHGCDFPAEILDRPRLTSTKLGADLSSYEIDREVRASASSGHSLYAMRTELLKALRPDLIITQEQCSVCAITRERTICALEELGLQAELLSLAANDLSGVYKDIIAIGSATGRTPEAERLVDRLQDQVKRIETQTSALSRPRVFCLSWFDPLMAAGSSITEMVGTAGGDPRLGSKPKESSRVSAQEVAEELPEIIFLLPCSFSQQRTAEEWMNLRGSLPWSRLPAVREGKVFTLASGFFHRFGPRLVDGIKLMAALIHPGCCSLLAPDDFSRRVA
jgi:iron complex transport system substrate-binding protein